MITGQSVTATQGREWWMAPPTVAPVGRGALAFWATIAVTFTALIAPQQYLPVLASLRIVLLSAVVAICACLIDRLAYKEPLLTGVNVWLGAALAGWALATLPLSYSAGDSLTALIGFSKSLALFWLFSNVVNTPARLRVLAWAITLMAIPMSSTALSNFLSESYLPDAPERIAGYDAPLVGNPNDLALMINLIIPLSIALLFTAERPIVRTFLIAVIVLDVVALVVTFSRGGFLTLATITAAYIWKLRSRPERSWLWGAVILALICLPFLPAGYIDRMSTITDIEADGTGSAQMRKEDAGTAVTFVVQHPIVGAGIGVGAFALGGENGARSIHNAYLEYAVDLGIPGLLLFALLLGRSLKSAGAVQRFAQAAKQDLLFHLAVAIQISLLAFAVAAFFHPVGYTLHFYYLAGLAVAISTHTGIDRSLVHRPVPQPPDRRATHPVIARNNSKAVTALRGMTQLQRGTQ